MILKRPGICDMIHPVFFFLSLPRNKSINRSTPPKQKSTRFAASAWDQCPACCISHAFLLVLFFRNKSKHMIRFHFKHQDILVNYPASKASGIAVAIFHCFLMTLMRWSSCDGPREMPLVRFPSWRFDSRSCLLHYKLTTFKKSTMVCTHCSKDSLLVFRQRS